MIDSDPPFYLRKGPTEDEMALQNLPYDLLLNVAQYLDWRDVHALHLTCRTLYDFSTTRPVYRKLANDLLRRCRALPLKGFQRLTDLSTPQLIRSVNKTIRYEQAWRVRAPRPITTAGYSHYMDVSGEQPETNNVSWYKVIGSPPGEEVDWLSPITSSYTLCATRNGKVVCWDVETDRCLAEWHPGEKWELWKCRVEFEEKAVFFTMAKILSGSYDDDRVMHFVLMQLRFSENPGEPPIFNHVTDFMTSGVIMNIFLLDPSARLLSAFVWVENNRTIALYALLDWEKSEYVFIDTGIDCVMSSNWSCILHEQNIVIHCEESDAAFQYFYPISLLATYTRPLETKHSVPAISGRVSPALTLTKSFIFPKLDIEGSRDEPPDTPLTPVIVMEAGDDEDETENGDVSTGSFHSVIPLLPSIPPSPSNGTVSILFSSDSPIPNPFPVPRWYPESAHFVRQWWPSLPGIPRLSCTVVLLASHDPDTHQTRFVLAQHYFKVPITRARDNEESLNILNKGKGKGDSLDLPFAEDDDDTLMRLWYVSTPFEVVCVIDRPDEDEDGANERPRPLVAVDFGYAVWIEYVDNEDDRASRPTGDAEAKWLRFVAFPSFGETEDEERPQVGVKGQVRTLEVPAELDLDSVETINIDQSQGAVIMSVKGGKIFILCYE